MQSLIQFKRTTLLFLIPLALGLFGVSSRVQAVSPAPDGGYPNFTTAEGDKALFSLTSGAANTAIGWFSLESVTTGSFNTAVGAGSLVANTADQNTATGAGALLSDTIGGFNTACGAFSLSKNTTGVGNTACGQGALFSNTTGGDNIAIGASSLAVSTTGTFNIAVGAAAGGNITTANNVICIGASGANVSNTCFISSIRGVTTINNDAVPVVIDSGQQLGTISSSRRYKTDIKPIDKASESILALKPVSFRYKVHKDTTPQFGLIAEDVAEVNPNLVIYDSDGKPYTVRYEAVNAMLLNEFLKEHGRVQELEATVAQQRRDSDATAVRQQKEIEALTAVVQKVSAQLAAASPSLADLK